MFRDYRPEDDELREATSPNRPPLNTLEAPEVERLVSALPAPIRTALRWFYVFGRVRVGVVKAELGLRADAQLRELLAQGRTAVDNALNFRAYKK